MIELDCLFVTGCKTKEQGYLLKSVFEKPYLRVSLCMDIDTVEMCGALVVSYFIPIRFEITLSFTVKLKNINFTCIWNEIYKALCFYFPTLYGGGGIDLPLSIHQAVCM